MSARVLLGVTVTAADSPADLLGSVRRLAATGAPADLLVLDDSSDAEASAEVAHQCQVSGVLYHRAPRRLGRTRAANLALRAAATHGYDHAVLLLGETLAAAGVVDGLTAAAESTGAAVVMAWSSTADDYGLGIENATRYLNHQSAVDQVGASLSSNFGDVVFDVPSAAAPCVLVPTRAVRELGLLDPVFADYGSGLTDWSLRARSHGWRVCLAPGTFVLDAGSRANGTGPDSPTAQGTALVDLRYPQFRDQLVAFRSSGLIAAARIGASRRMVLDGARTNGYTLEVGWVASALPRGNAVRCRVTPDAPGVVTCELSGFAFTFGFTEGADPAEVVEDFFGTEPVSVATDEDREVAPPFAGRVGRDDDRLAYPARI